MTTVSNSERPDGFYWVRLRDSEWNVGRLHADGSLQTVGDYTGEDGSESMPPEMVAMYEFGPRIDPPGARSGEGAAVAAACKSLLGVIGNRTAGELFDLGVSEDVLAVTWRRLDRVRALRRAEGIPWAGGDETEPAASAVDALRARQRDLVLLDSLTDEQRAELAAIDARLNEIAPPGRTAEERETWAIVGRLARKLDTPPPLPEGFELELARGEPGKFGYLNETIRGDINDQVTFSTADEVRAVALAMLAWADGR
jgi:hypothetical protein